MNGILIGGGYVFFRSQCTSSFEQPNELQAEEFAELPGRSYPFVAGGVGDLELVLASEFPQVARPPR